MRTRSMITLSVLCAALSPALSQEKRTLEFKIKGVANDTVYLANYYGNKLFYADTAIANSKGEVVFDRKKGYRSGVFAVVVPGPKYFEFIVNEPQVKMETNATDLVGGMNVITSEENKRFFNYIRFLNDRKKEGDVVRAEREEATDPVRISALDAQLVELDEQVSTYQQQLVADAPTSYTATIVRMSMPVELDRPRLPDGRVDSLAAYYQFRAHFWDNVDLNDQRILYTPVFQNKFDEYIGKVIPQVPDTINKLVDELIAKMEGDRELFKFGVHNVTYKYETSDIMGMDAVFVHMALTYYCPRAGEESRAYWLSADKLEKLCERARKMAPIVIGAKAEEIILTDTTQQHWVSTHALPHEYVLLAFWDPHCGHCKKELPKVYTYYKEHLKGMDLEVVAVAKATDSTLFKDWKKFIREHDLQWTNIGLTPDVYDLAKKNARELIPQYTTLKSLNYAETYDVYTTPKFFLLDRDRKIIGKQLAPEQVKDLIEHRREKALK